MNYFRKLFLLSLLSFLIVSFTLECSCTKIRNDDRIIQEIILDYGFYREKAVPQVEFLLSELEDRNSSAAQLWKGIWEDWQYTSTSLEINYDRLADYPENEDELCIVVLGFQLNPDGSIQDELVGRLQTALTCARQYPKSHLLCTGGGTAANNRSVTEAGQMAEWLKQHGIDASRIIVEDQSRTTGQNAAFSYDILQNEYPEIKSLVIVTSDYHIPWGMILFMAKLRMAAQEDESDLHIIGHAAYKAIEHKNYAFLNQAAGLLELAGYEKEALSVYYGLARPPRLEIREPKINRR